ncbi:thermonuclease family protein [Brucella sp. BE17]|uniref:thermonuclease family protein n=1 Tax=Brucella sp. BE17 TaxID=3142977 RepID=UPI0031BA47DA
MRGQRRPYRQSRKGNHHSKSKRILRRKLDIYLTLLIFLLLILITLHIQKETSPSISFQGKPHVIDGDTVIIEDVRIRLIGIDAPEIAQSCERGGAAYECGKEARTILRSRIGKSPIRCDGHEKDIYGRVLARCYLAGTDLNGWMVQQGWAVAYGDYKREEAEARANKGGLWMGQFEQPSSWRKSHGQDAKQNARSAPDAIGRISDYIREQIDAFINLF